MPFLEVNWLAVILAAVFNMALGALWYGPIFGSLWLRLIGRKAEDIQSPGILYLLPLIAGLVSAYVLAVIVAGFGLATWYMGAIAGAVVWIGGGAAAGLTNSVFEDRHFGVWALFAVYQLIVYAVEGAVFAIW